MRPGAKYGALVREPSASKLRASRETMGLPEWPEHSPLKRNQCEP
jgi:hypothetical protein